MPGQLKDAGTPRLLTPLDSRLRLTVGLGVLVLTVGIFFLFSYNSGYGFDGLEYLIIARSLLGGYPMYAFIPSKSPGLYAVIASWMASGIPQNHTGVSIMVTFSLVLLLVSAWFVTKRIYDSETAALTCMLIVVSAFTMELNFLKPEGLVAACGLIASWFLYLGYSRESSIRTKWWFAAGIMIGFGCSLKTVSALYWLGAAVFAGWLLYARLVTWKSARWAVVSLTVGAALPQATEWIYFALTGRSQDFLLWTYIFPLRYYPADTIYLSKLLVKCGWLALVVLAAAYCSHRWKRPQDSRTALVLAMAGASLISLLKTQASHYLVPSAVFLAMYAASVFAMGHHAGRFVLTGKGAIASVVVVAAVCAGFTAKSRPDVFRRFISVRDYSWEERLAETVVTQVGPKNRLFAVQGSMLLYWVSKRYPPFPCIHTERQTTYWLERHPDALIGALGDPRLTLVAVDETRMALDDPKGFESQQVRSAFAGLVSKLPERFESTSFEWGYKFWVRRNHM